MFNKIQTPYFNIKFLQQYISNDTYNFKVWNQLYNDKELKIDDFLDAQMCSFSEETIDFLSETNTAQDRHQFHQQNRKLQVY